MNREIVIKLATNQQVTQEELNTFIVDYVKQEKGIDLHPQELQGIIKAIAMRVFDLTEAVKITARKLNIQIAHIIDIKKNTLLKTYTYDT